MEYLEFWEFSLALTYAYNIEFIIHFCLMSLVLTRFLCPQHFFRPLDALWSIVWQSDIFFFFFYILRFQPWKLKMTSCWHLFGNTCGWYWGCWVINLCGDSYFLSLVSVFLLWSWLHTDSHHASIRQSLFCSTMFFSAFSLCFQPGRNILTEHR